ncbi:MAG: aldehyde:ferredoxin oxidoreductase, partial [Chloroflexi bacterium]|nr:aldehyde:ferredoxin oxidoreductase [Chloroflexota bacterium]
KALSVARHQNWRTVGNALVLCQFANVPPATTRDLLNAATGYGDSLDELMRLGERAWNLKRAINNRLGLTRANDKLPTLLLKPYAEGGAAGFVPDLDTLLTDYCRVRGWDEATGRPTRLTLSALGLPDVADDLWGRAA